MIRINRALERAKRRRGLWIVLVILLAILLALVALHSFGDGITSDGAVFCAVIVLLVALVVTAPIAPARILVPMRVGRAPPRRVTERVQTRSLFLGSAIPLRL